MIVLNLSCDLHHTFEGWFPSAEIFEQQVQQGLVLCPQCGSQHIERRPTAPHIMIHHTADQVSAEKKSNQTHLLMDYVKAELRQLAKKSEDVDQDFPKEARKIHYKQAPARNIKGRATIDEISELVDEGIPVLPIPEDEIQH